MTHWAENPNVPIENNENRFFDSPDTRKEWEDMANKLFIQSTELEEKIWGRDDLTGKLSELWEKKKMLADYTNDPKNLGQDGVLTKDAMKGLQSLYNDLEKIYKELNGKIHGSSAEWAKTQIQTSERNSDLAWDFQKKILGMMNAREEKNQETAQNIKKAWDQELERSGEKASTETEAAFSIEYP